MRDCPGPGGGPTGRHSDGDGGTEPTERCPPQTDEWTTRGGRSLAGTGLSGDEDDDGHGDRDKNKDR